MSHWLKSSSSYSSPKLPPELWAEIFLLCPYDKSTLKCLGTPWTLGRVCRDWRAIALNLRRLWSTVYIDLDEIMLYPTGWEWDYPWAQPYLPILSAALQRAGDTPLNIIIHLEHKATCLARYPYQASEFRSLFRLLADRHKQWNSLVMSPNMSVEAMYLFFFLSPIDKYSRKTQANALGNLRKIAVDFKALQVRDAEHYRLLWLLQSLQETSILDSVSLLGCGRKGGIRMENLPSLPWQQLKHLEFHGVLPSSSIAEELLSTLSKCARLETLIFGNGPSDNPITAESHFTNSEFISIQSLQKLVLTPESAALICQRVILPRLEYLQLEGLFCSTILVHVEEMLGRSFCTVKAFQVGRS